MDFAVILIYLCIALIAVSLLIMIGFGLKNAGNTLSQSKLGLFAFAFPLIVFAITFAISQDAPFGAWKTAGVLTAVITALAGFVALIVSGAKSLVS